MSEERAEHQPWPARALLLLALGALFGLIFDTLVSTGGEASSVFGNWTSDAVRLSLATFVAISGLVLAFTLERSRWQWTIGFAVASGAVLGLIRYWSGSPEGGAGDIGWRFFSGLLAVAIAAPLFQTLRDEGRWHLPYAAVHAHSWTNVVLWFAAWAFVLITSLLILLLSQLFHLIGIELLSDLLEEDWFVWMMICGALGSAAGLLRDRDRVLGLLQRVVTTILAVLAPILAVGLVLFVIALPFTGLAPLWDQTRATTPILLSCVIGAIILVNAVIGNSPEEEAEARALRWSAMALAAVMAPLVAVAAISTGVRIDQHGFTPSRLWALVFVGIAAGYALLYLASLIRGRAGWTRQIRRDNIRLAIGVCAVALLLATPLISFGAISTRDQLARLESGRIPPNRFDWAAMRFDFGPSGVRALERLKASSGSSEIRAWADRALAAHNRWTLVRDQFAGRRPEPLRIRVLPEGAAIPEPLHPVLRDSVRCPAEMSCIMFLRSDHHAVLVQASACGADPAGVYIPPNCRPNVRHFHRDEGNWREGSASPRSERPLDRARARELADAVRQGRVELREVRRMQVFVDGEPVEEPFE